MNTNPPLYLSYTDANGMKPYFQLLQGEADAALIHSSAGILGRFVTKLHVRSPREGDRPIEIAAITDARFDREQAEAIGQEAINWLRETGAMPFRSGEEP